MAKWYEKAIRKTKNAVGDAAISTFTNRNERRAAARAAGQLTEGTNKAQEAEKTGFQQAFNYQQPYADVGGQAFKDLYSRLQAGEFRGPEAPPVQDFAQMAKSYAQIDPGAQYRQDQARKQFEAGAAARGNLFGSGALRAQQGISQDLASQEFGNAYNRGAQAAQSQIGQTQNRYDQIRQGLGEHYNRLQSLANVGQQTAQNMSNLASGQGQANAGYAQDQANILAGQTQANETSRAAKSASNLNMLLQAGGALAGGGGMPSFGGSPMSSGNANTQSSAQGLNAMNYKPSSASNYYNQFSNPMTQPNLSSATYQSAQPGSNFMMGQQPPQVNQDGYDAHINDLYKKIGL